MSTIKKKKNMALLTSFYGVYWARSSVCRSEQHCHLTTPELSSINSNVVDAGGSDEDPLPTLSGLHKNKYNGTLFRSTTSRPLVHDIMVYKNYVESLEIPQWRQNVASSELVFKWYRIFGLIKRYLLIKTRDLHRLANLLYFPTIDILFGGLIWMWREQANPDLGHACAEYLLGLIFWIVANATQFETSFNFLEEFQSRNLVNLFASILEHTEWLMASALLSIVESLMSLVICSVIAYLGFGINVLTLGWFLPIFAILFIASGWIIAIFTTGLFLIFGQRATFLIWAMPYFILPLSAPFYPIAALPGWVQIIAYCLPTTYLFEGIRLVAFQHSLPVAYTWISFILTIVYGCLAVLFFDKMFKKSKERGLARLEVE